MIRVLLADDDEAVLSALSDLLSAASGFDVVGTALDGSAALALAAHLHPNAAIVDVRMPGGGAELVRRLREQVPGLCVIGLSAQADDHSRKTMLEAGAAAYVVKGDRAMNLPQTLKECLTPAEG